MEIKDGSGFNAAHRYSMGCVLGSLEREHMGAGEVGAPGKTGIFQ